METVGEQVETALNGFADLIHGPLESFTPALVQVKTKAGPLDYFYLNRPQVYLHKRLEEQKARTGKVRALIPKARQLGVSTYVAARFYRKTITEEGCKTFIMAHEDEAAANLFEKVRLMHQNMPTGAAPGARNDSAKALTFEHLNSGYAVGTARTTGRGRSQTVQCLHASEVAFWPVADHMSGIFQTVANQGNTEIIVESTGNGPQGLFYDLVRQAQRGEGAGEEYEVIFLPWFWEPSYRVTPPDGWEPTGEWAEYGEIHGLDRKQLRWAFLKNAELAADHGGETDAPSWVFKKEYPATLEEAFIEQDTDSLIQPEAVLRARKREIEPMEDAPHLLGVDVASDGGDQSYVIDRKGRRAGWQVQQSLQTGDLMQVVGTIAELHEQHKFDRIFIDSTGGYGSGVVDRLREIGYGAVVSPINFGAKATQDGRFMNKRVEMYWKLMEWLNEEGGADIPDDDRLHSHLTATQRKPDSNGRVAMERKADIKARLGFSPDGADSLALTFAQPVQRPDTVEREPVRHLRNQRRNRRKNRSWMVN